jgi:hypothetical protein
MYVYSIASGAALARGGSYRRLKALAALRSLLAQGGLSWRRPGAALRLLLRRQQEAHVAQRWDAA